MVRINCRRRSWRGLSTQTRGNRPSCYFRPAASTSAPTIPSRRLFRLLAHGAWTHVNGAFGLWAAASLKHRHRLQGVGLADSWTCDCHKWLNTPFDCGYAFVADADAHRTAFSRRTSYSMFVGDPREIDWNPDWSRRGRAVPTYAALRQLGRSGIAGLIDAVRIGYRFPREPPGRALLHRPRCPASGLERARLSGRARETEHRDTDHLPYRSWRYPNVGARDQGRSSRISTKPFRDQDLIDAIQAAIRRDRRRLEEEREIAALEARHRSLTARERDVMALLVSGRVN